MDFVTALRFVHQHNDKVLAALIVLFLVTAITLLLRSIGKNGQGAAAGAGMSGGTPVDVESLEAAMRKVLASTPMAVVAGASSAGASAPSGPLTPESEAAVAERELQIEVLQIALKEARDQAAQALAMAPAGGVDSPAAESAMKTKIDELEAKLFEYEIITDDIADLSLYKDENARMKSEIDDMRSRLDAAVAAAASVPEPAFVPEPASVPAPVPAASVSRIAQEQEAELKFEKAEKFELDINDDVMKAFAEAVDSGRIEKAEGAYSLPQDEVEPEVRASLEASLETKLAATLDAAMSPSEPHNASADLALGDSPATGSASAKSSTSTSASATDAADPQAAIDAMLAQMSAPEAVESAVAAAPAAIASVEPMDAQAMIDAMLREADSASATPAVETAELAEALPGETLAARDNSAPAEGQGDAPADPLASLLTTDAEKMISEVESLSASADNEAASAESDPLLETLDTDKLLSEVASLSTEQNLNETTQDDLFAEFKDEKGNES